jgi:hypothetical protein
MTWQTTKTTASYTPAVLLWPDGRQQKCNVLAARLDSVAAARERLALDKPAWVRAEDVGAVTGALGEVG